MGDAEKFLSEVGGLIQYFSKSLTPFVSDAERFLSEVGLIQYFSKSLTPFVSDAERFLSEVGLIQYFSQSMPLKSSHYVLVMLKDFSLR